MKWPFVRAADPQAAQLEALRVESERARALIEESRELVIVLDDRNRVLAASRRARESLDGVAEGRPVPDELLETAALPGEDAVALVERARREVEQVRELIDDVLFLSELETGRAVVALGATHALPVVEKTLADLRERADRADVRLRSEGDDDVELPLRPRMLRVVVANLTENALRYAGPGSTFTVSVAPGELRAADDGSGVSDDDLPRLFERFYRADRVRGSRGTGLGLAIVKHVVSAADGSVEAARSEGHGLSITCTFPSR